RPDAPVALAEDRDLLADSALLLETVLATARTAATQVFTPAGLCGKGVAVLKKPLEASSRRQVERRSLPATVRCLLQRNKPLLFLSRDVLSSVPEYTRQGPPRSVEQPSTQGFATAFDDAFQRLDRQKGSHNFVSLVDLRPALAYDRQ